MRNPTDLMRAILTSEMAQEIIDHVPPVYGDARVALWLFQAAGAVLDEAKAIVNQLAYEGNPITSVLLLDLWEDHYGLPRNPSLTIENRQNRLRMKRLDRAPFNPKKLEELLSSALNGATVKITENISKNTFKVTISDPITSIQPAVDILERVKPAHLIYIMEVALEMVAETDLRTAIAITHAEMYRVDIEAALYNRIESELDTVAPMTHSESYKMEVQ